jgi:hypothetical protein
MCPNLHNSLGALFVALTVTRSGVDLLDRRQASGDDSWDLRWNLLHRPIHLRAS